MEFKEILQTKPNGFYSNVRNVIVNTYERYSSGEKVIIAYPELELFCSNDKCNGIRSFVHDLYPYTNGDPEIRYEPFVNDVHILDYLCSNCKEEMKYFAIKIEQIENTEDADVYKFGEFPHRIEKLPTKLISLFGSEKELLIKGKNCESQGFGLGALTYYRRIVENQRNKLYDSIIKTIKNLGDYDSEIAKIEKAKNETQFTKSIDLVRSLIPKELYIEGYNPLTLLHSAMSKGVHNLHDEECLEIAKNIRIVLAEFTNRMTEISMNQTNLKKAVKKLNELNKRST